MNVRDFIPWSRDSNQAPISYRGSEQNPFLTLHREMNRLFDDIFRGFEQRLPTSSGNFPAFGGGWPNVEVTDKDKEILVTAELPGLEEKDIEVLFDDGVLTLRGEKRSESEDKNRQFSERFYGRFERRIPLGYEVDESKVDAGFKNGLLRITLPKSERAQTTAKRIAINAK
jgi:HSP20 family protein